MAQGGVVVFGGRQPACILRLAPRHFSSPPFYLFSSASTINEGFWPSMSLFQIRIKEISLIFRLYIMFFCGRFLDFFRKLQLFCSVQLLKMDFFYKLAAAARRCSAPLTGSSGCATSQGATGDISSRAAPFPWIGKGRGDRVESLSSQTAVFPRLMC